MSYYLYMDGVDDYIKIPSVSFTRIEMDMKVYEGYNNKQQRYWSLPFGADYVHRNASNTGNYTDYYSSGVSSVLINGQEATNNTKFVPIGERIIMDSHSVNSHIIYIFANNGNTAFVEGDLFSIKIYDGENIVAHYDMSTGTVQDQSGNNNHATLHGGTWMDDGGGTPTNPPSVNVISTSQTKISDEPNMDRTYITFQFDQDVTEWVVRVLGSSWDTGFLADSGGQVPADTDIVAEIDWLELQQEGQNRVNIYGLNSNGDWTPYYVEEDDGIIVDHIIRN